MLVGLFIQIDLNMELISTCFIMKQW